MESGLALRPYRFRYGGSAYFGGRKSISPDTAARSANAVKLIYVEEGYALEHVIKQVNYCVIAQGDAGNPTVPVRSPVEMPSLPLDTDFHNE
jgi:hypothetical protein